MELRSGGRPFPRVICQLRRNAPCSFVSAAHYENFPVASFLLPSALRPAVLAIYRFARGADDIADEGESSPCERLAGLDAYERGLDAIERGEAPAEAPFAELAAAIERHRLPVALLRDLLSAFRQDVFTQRYGTYALLQDYCRRSANPIGRLLLQLYRVTDTESLERSDAICTALQLVNFWQDIAIDWRKGRVYLPLEDLARFGVAETQIAEARSDDAWRTLIAFECARTRALLESGRPLTRSLPWRLALELSGVLAGGHRILDRIESARGDVFLHRPQLGLADWIVVAWHAVAPPRRHRLVPTGAVA
jgi:squalene synthase HpnC